MKNDYNKIAGYYDKLSRMVFRRSIIKAHQYLIDFIKDNDRILLVGGGTGWILEEIANLEKKNVMVVYVEKSSKMMELSKKRKLGDLTVEFVNSPIESYQTNEHFDIVLTPFLFDNFMEKRIQYVFKKLDANLKPKGFWLYADFVDDKETKSAWKTYLLKTMYVFFSLTANVEARKLIDISRYFSEKYVIITRQLYYKRFIQAVAYRKIK